MTEERSSVVSRRSVLAGSVAAVAAVAASRVPSGARTSGLRERPNIVLVLADDLGYGELGCYNQPDVMTPNLDKLAAEGRQHSQFYAGNCVCAPSRCSLFTGRHNGHASIRWNHRIPPLPASDVTMGEVMKRAGYKTAVFGKWGLSHQEPDSPGHPNNQGFDEFFGHLSHGTIPDYWPPYLWHNRAKHYFPDNTGDNKGTWSPWVVLSRTLTFIEQHKDEPFFVVLATNLVHGKNEVPSIREAYATKDWPIETKAHAEQITRLDTHVGIVRRKLEELNLADDTILIFTSDNGPHDNDGLNPNVLNSNGDLRGIKRTLYEGGIRVPMVVWSGKDGNRVSPATVDHPWVAYDLLPTVATLTGTPVAVPAGIYGLSMLPLLTGDPATAPTHDYIYHAWTDAGYGTPTAGRPEIESVRFGPWKAVRFAPDAQHPTLRTELYNLDYDPGETTDVAVKHPGVTQQANTYCDESWTNPT